MRSDTGIWEVIAGAVAALHRTTKAHQIYFFYLLVQTICVALWWPKFDFPQALEMHDGPDPLLAVFLALGLTGAFFSLRWGAQEIAFDGGARIARVGPDPAWPPGPGASSGSAVPRVGPGAFQAQMDAAAPVVGRFGFVIAVLTEQLVFSVYACLLAAPLLLSVMAVGGGSSHTLGWGIAVLVALWLSYRWLGLALGVLMGHERPELFVVLRGVYLLLTLVPAFGLPAASVVRVGFLLYGDFAGASSGLSGGGHGLERVWAFIAINGLATIALAVFVCRRLGGFGRWARPSESVS